MDCEHSTQRILLSILRHSTHAFVNSVCIGRDSDHLGGLRLRKITTKCGNMLKPPQGKSVNEENDPVFLHTVLPSRWRFVTFFSDFFSFFCATTLRDSLKPASLLLNMHHSQNCACLYSSSFATPHVYLVFSSFPMLQLNRDRPHLRRGRQR